MDVDILGENNTFVDHLRLAIRDGACGLDDVPGLLKCILRDNRWREFRTKHREVAHHERFEDFVKAPPLVGLGTNMDLVKRLCSDDNEALDLLDQALLQPIGRPSQNINNVNINGDRRDIEEVPQGNSAQRAIRKLRQDRPDLLAKVIAGEASPHGAMIEAGFRTRELSIPAEPTTAARRLALHFQGERLDELIAALEQYRGAPPKPSRSGRPRANR